MKIRFAAIARRELFAAADHYNGKRLGLGEQFLTEVTRRIGQLKTVPGLGPIYREPARKLGLRRFPYSLIYEIRADGIIIHAVAHMRRRPLYWVRRMGTRSS